MRYVSLFSGIEAATVAWEPLGWEPVAFVENDEFPAAVLAHRFPDVPNLGDIRKVDWEEFTETYGAVDVVCGGSPCTTFSVAGRRDGLAGDSGRLMYEYIRAVQSIRSEWLVWENVPNALAIEGGKAFGQLVSALDECGYCVAWRVLDSQFARIPVRDGGGAIAGWYGPVPQRRRRVFLVGHLGDERAAEVLFEPSCMRGGALSSAEKRKALASDAGRCAHGACGSSRGPVAFKWYQGAGARSMPSYDDGSTPTLAVSDSHVPAVSYRSETLICMTSGQAHGEIDDDLCGTLSSRSYKDPPIVIDRAVFNQGKNAQYHPHIEETEVMDALVARGPHAVATKSAGTGYVTRRITPVEAERLQMFPDDWTNLEGCDVDAVTERVAASLCYDEAEAEALRRKIARWSTRTPDGLRYKAIGNSMATNVMRMIGDGIREASHGEETSRAVRGDA